MWQVQAGPMQYGMPHNNGIVPNMGPQFLQEMMQLQLRSQNKELWELKNRLGEAEQRAQREEEVSRRSIDRT
jgi:hypothetical protein